MWERERPGSSHTHGAAWAGADRDGAADAAAGGGVSGSTAFRRRRVAAGLCPDCGAEGGWCRACRDVANARHKRWRDANRDHFRAAQGKQRKRRRRLRALEKAGRVTVELRRVGGRDVLAAIVAPRRKQ